MFDNIMSGKPGISLNFIRLPNRAFFSLLAILLPNWLTFAPLSAQFHPTKAPVTAIAVAPDGTSILVGSQAGVQILSWPELRALGELATELVNVHDLQFSPDGKTLLAAGGTPAESGIVEQWDWPAATLQWRVTLADDVVYRAAWLPDGRRFAVASATSRCAICDRETGQAEVWFSGHSRPVLAIESLGDQWLVSAGVDQTIRVWKQDDALLVRTLDNHLGTVTGIRLDPIERPGSARRMVTIGHDRTIRLWNPSVGRMIRFQKLPGQAACVGWTPDGKTILVGSSAGDLLILDSSDLQIRQSEAANVGAIHELAISPQPTTVLLGGDRGLRALAIPQTDSP